MNCFLSFLLLSAVLGLTEGYFLFPRYLSTETNQRQRIKKIYVPRREDLPQRLDVRIRAKKSRAVADGEDEIDVDRMRIAEVKSELDLRGVKYDDVFEGRELRKRLEEVRLKGRADPKLVDKFNQAKEIAIDLSEENIQAVKGVDGTVPGGLRPDELQKLAANPDIIKLMANPDFQKIMKEAMQGGPEALAKYENDPKIRDLMQTAASLVQDAGLAPPGGGSVPSSSS